MNEDLTFETLVSSIKQVHEELAAQTAKAVNISLTLRNWLIGLYIAKFELDGADRANYGEKMLFKLAEHLTKLKVSNCSRRQLYEYLEFYRVYPQIGGTVSAQLQSILPTNLADEIKVPTASAQLSFSPEKLIKNLSYSKFRLLVNLDDDLKRSFYEIECIRGNWSVRELDRQIHSLYYERSGLSKNKDKLSELTNLKAELQEAKLAIRDPYIFEFLGLKPKEVMDESDVETLLLNKLQEFLFEMGNGFCFEARQKRILIDDTHYFVDLVFYHRILKCHILADIKIGKFSHESIGQLNTYVSWYKKNMMEDGDNPPVGILLCTEKQHTLVEYALAGMDNQLFVSKYQLELPTKEDMLKFIETEMREVEEN